jgi:3-hydroxybutyryl-CoA dehydrogenase
VYDTSAEALAAGAARLAASLAALVKRGRLDESEANGIAARVQWVSDLNALAPCTLIIEAILEDAAIKQALFAELEAVVSDEALLATNTSSLSVARLAKQLSKPDRFLGMHFFNPPTAMKLVEVVRGPATSNGAETAIVDFASSWGKKPVRVADVPGFIVNRVARPFYAEAFRALQERAAPPEAIDHLFRASAGFKMGPLELTDLIGQDVNYAVARSVYDSYFGVTRFTPQLAQRTLVDAGWLGRKSGRGVYDYTNGNPPQWHPPESPSDTPQNVLDFLSHGGFSDHAGVIVRRTRGLRASSEAAATERPVALIDWFDEPSATSIAYAGSDAQAIAAARDLISTTGRSPIEVADRPGLIVMRTLAQIANAAGDAVFEHVSDDEDIDQALRFGANYPFGPCAWAHCLGVRELCAVLRNIQGETGQAMYTPSEHWSALA